VRSLSLRSLLARFSDRLNHNLSRESTPCCRALRGSNSAYRKNRVSATPPPHHTLELPRLAVCWHHSTPNQPRTLTVIRHGRFSHSSDTLEVLDPQAMGRFWRYHLTTPERLRKLRVW
jgi:hypothetical protein